MGSASAAGAGTGMLFLGVGPGGVSGGTIGGGTAGGSAMEGGRTSSKCGWAGKASVACLSLVSAAGTMGTVIRMAPMRVTAAATATSGTITGAIPASSVTFPPSTAASGAAPALVVATCEVSFGRNSPPSNRGSNTPASPGSNLRTSLSILRQAAHVSRWVVSFAAAATDTFPLACETSTRLARWQAAGALSCLTCNSM
jgi:hypothetical protein